MFDEFGGEITCVSVVSVCEVGSRRPFSTEGSQHGAPGSGSGGFFSPSEFSVCQFSDGSACKFSQPFLPTVCFALFNEKERICAASFPTSAHFGACEHRSWYNASFALSFTLM